MSNNTTPHKAVEYDDNIKKHKDRFNKSYFPITIPEHLELLKNTGFDTYEVFLDVTYTMRILCC